MVRSFLGALRGIIFALWLGVSILILNAVQLVSLLVCMFSPKTFRRFNSFLANFWWGICANMVKWGGTKILFTGEELPPSKNAVLIVNHQSTCDIPVLLCLAQRNRRLGHMKWFVKNAFRYFPGPGWGLQFLDNVFVKRDWTRDRGRIQRVFGALTRYRLPFWLVSFSEGTRATPEKMARSRAYCAAQNKPVLQHVMAPRTKGFVSTIEALRGQIDGVYDVTIAFPPKVPSILRLFAGRCGEVHVHIKRYPVALLPDTSEGLSQWVWERFQEKDRYLDAFYKRRDYGQVSA
jgi:1-acyl-sn-glycerol-3-phosphate acyltransferase